MVKPDRYLVTFLGNTYTESTLDAVFEQVDAEFERLDFRPHRHNLIVVSLSKFGLDGQVQHLSPSARLLWHILIRGIPAASVQVSMEDVLADLEESPQYRKRFKGLPKPPAFSPIW